MEALAAVPVSTLCDVDKSLPVVDPALRPLTYPQLYGPAYTVVASGEFLSVLYAIGEAAPGDVLVIQAGGAPLAALGELLATEAWRRGLGGIVVDGYVRDRTGSRRTCPCGRAAPCRWRAAAMWHRASAARSCAAACGWRPATSCSPTTTDRDRAARAARGLRWSAPRRSSAPRRRCSASVQGGAFWSA